MNAAQAKKLLARRRLKQKPFDTSILFDPRFPQQKGFCEDPAKWKALFCTRRASKTFTAGLYMVQTAMDNPGVNILFVALTKDTAWDIIYKDVLKVIVRKHKLGVKRNLVNKTLTFPNGSVIKVIGIDSDQAEMDKTLGKKYKLVCVDECSLYTVNLRRFVYDILGPATADQAGTICLFGTASDYPRGLFYDITKLDGVREEGWSLWQWSALDNPFIEWQKLLDEIKAKRPSYLLTKQYQQWYENKWVIDDDKLVYKFSESKNLCNGLPKLNPEGWTFVLGVDTGWEDSNGFVVTGYHINDPNLYVVKAYKQNKMTFDQVVAKIEEFRNDPLVPIAKVVIDNANKQGVESMRSRSKIPFEYTQKADKVTFIEMMNGDLVQSKIKFCPGTLALITEMKVLVWKTKAGDIIYPKKEDPTCENHLCDAFLYSWRMGYHFNAEPEEEKIVIGTKRWYDKQHEEVWEREREALVNKRDGDWGSDDGSGFSNL